MCCAAILYEISVKVEDRERVRRDLERLYAERWCCEASGASYRVIMVVS